MATAIEAGQCFRLFGREWYVPLASTLVLSFVVSLLMKAF